MNSVEDAYQAIADTLNRWGLDGWRSMKFQVPIYKTMCGGMSFSQFDDEGAEKTPAFDWDGIEVVNRATLFLRDDLIRTTGQRTWGMLFTLYPDGKFTIEYDYNKPEGYEETDETIDVSLPDFAAQINKK
jgi:hypothetical protein